MQLIKIADKTDYLRKHNVPEDIIDLVMNVSKKYSVWLAREIIKDLKAQEKYIAERQELIDKNLPPRMVPLLPSGFTFPISNSTDRMRHVVDWAEATSPNIMQLTFSQAKEESDKWHQELKNREHVSNYISHDVVYQFEDGWQVVKMQAKDLDSEGELMGHCVGGEYYEKNVESGMARIYSLRDPNNLPHATIEMAPGEQTSGVTQIQGKGNDEPIDKYKEKIKEWFASLQTKGHQLVSEPNWDYMADVNATNFLEDEMSDEYGLTADLTERVGGNKDTYSGNLEEIENNAWVGSNYFRMQIAVTNLINLIEYASKRSELKQLEEAVQMYSEKVWERFNEWSESHPFDNPYPHEKDFTTYPEESTQQPEFSAEGFEESKKSFLDQEAYDEALERYDEERGYLEKHHEPTEFVNKAYEMVQEAIAKSSKEKKQEVAAHSKTQIYRISENKMQLIKIADKTDYLRKHNVPEDIIDIVMNASKKYSVWLAREIMKVINERAKYNNKNLTAPKTPYSVTLGDMKHVVDWAEATSPNIMKLTFQEAMAESNAWHEKLKNQEHLSSYVSNDIQYTFKDGWTIVKMQAGDLNAEGELMGHCVGGKGYEKAIESGNSAIYSLRDPSGMPHATIEMEPEEKSSTIVQIQGKGNEEPIGKYKEKLKEWFKDIQEVKGHNLEREVDYWDSQELSVLDALNEETDDYGLQADIGHLIGGSANNWKVNLESIEASSWVGQTFDSGEAQKAIDKLTEYAYKKDDLNDLIQAVEQLTEKASEDFRSTEINLQNPYPIVEDFMIYPFEDLSSKENTFEESKKPYLNEIAYNEALEKHDEELSEYETENTSIQFANMAYKIVYDAERKRRKEETAQQQAVYEEELKQKRELTAHSNTKIYKISKNQGRNSGINKELIPMKTQIHKIAAEVPDVKLPTPETIAAFVESLQVYYRDTPKLKEELKYSIENLPSPTKIIKDYSIEECKLLYETIGHLWKKITGKTPIEINEIEESPVTLLGNYWMIKNGILLHGPNHLTIIKKNINLICSLLNVNGFALQEHLASPPEKLIRFILKNGGVRVFINKDREAYFQMSEETYSKWGRKKVKSLDFEPKIVKVIDFKAKYNGWSSGIIVKL